MSEVNTVFIGIGSNIGEREGNCLHALDLCNNGDSVRVIAVSSLYETEPWGHEDQQWFVNCAARLETSLGLDGTLSFLQNVEAMIGKKKQETWGPRAIDLDVLFFNDAVVGNASITVPHPFLHQRRFVLEPLAEIAPDWIHPVLKQQIRHLLQQVDDDKKVLKIKRSDY